MSPQFIRQKKLHHNKRGRQTHMCSKLLQLVAIFLVARASFLFDSTTVYYLLFRVLHSAQLSCGTLPEVLE